MAAAVCWNQSDALVSSSAAQGDGSEQGPFAQAAGEEVAIRDHLGEGPGPGRELGVGQQGGGPAVQMAAHRTVRHRRVLVVQDGGHQVGLVRFGDGFQSVQIAREAPVLGGLLVGVEAGHSAIPSGRSVQGLDQHVYDFLPMETEGMARDGGINRSGLGPGATRTIRLPAPPVDCDLSNDGTQVAVSLFAPPGVPSLCVFDTATGELVASAGAANDGGRGVAFGRDGACLYSLVAKHSEAAVELRRFSLGDDEGVAVAAFPARDAFGLTRNLTADLLAVLGPVVSVLHDDGSSPRPELVRVIQGVDHDRYVDARFPARGTYLYCLGVAEGHLVRWDLTGDREAGRWPAPSTYGRVTVSASGRYAFLANHGVCGTVAFDTSTHERFMPDFFNETGYTKNVAFSPDEAGFVYVAGRSVGFRNWTTQRRSKGGALHDARNAGVHGAWEADVYAFLYDDGYLSLATRP
ncbi:hypothetical protein [Streptomyces sp. NPDC002187]|uniref:hypothetical protein n=1 Tax=Streptomyces sp. NPDC002187 TaxID=3364637 RepID=UPI00368ADBC8